MNEYNEGDLVEAEQKEIVSSTRFRGILRRIKSAKGDIFTVRAQSYEPDLAWLIEQGFTVAVIERATPPLPTVTGIVVRISAGNGRRYWLAWYSNTGDWDVIDPRGDYHHAHPDPYQLVRDYQEPIDGFEVLEPAPDTARRVLARVRGLFGEGALILNEVDEIATEFGVTS